MRTFRVTQPKLSQYVFFRAIIGSVGAACSVPCWSMARLVRVCSPAAGLGQSIVHSFQAYGAL